MLQRCQLHNSFLNRYSVYVEKDKLYQVLKARYQ